MNKDNTFELIIEYYGLVTQLLSGPLDDASLKRYYELEHMKGMDKTKWLIDEVTRLRSLMDSLSKSIPGIQI